MSNLIRKGSCMGLILLPFSACASVHDQYVTGVRADLAKQPPGTEELLTEKDIAHLPPPVRKYLRYTGAVGKPKIHNVRMEFDAKMIKERGATPMECTSEQYNFFEAPARHFYLEASKFGIPFRVLHQYVDQKATMQVKVAGLFKAVDLSGAQLSEAETVTVLNDLCVFAPASLIDPRMTWKEIDASSAQVTFENGPYKVSAILYFNEKGELVNFISEDRSALQDDGTLRKFPWVTPISEYQEFNGRRVPTRGEAIWKYPDGDFTYGIFKLRKIEFNVKGFVN